MKKLFLYSCMLIVFIGCGSSKSNDDKTDETETEINDPLAVKKGEELFFQYCVDCHGIDAKGLSGPSIVGVIQEDIKEAILGESAMTYLQGVVLPKEQKLIAIYLDELAKT